ncbi:NAD(P)-binding domain-containing protein [Sphingomonas sp.]|uniref:flavin-containing monooxygenase n=1 Tax=Sphingomonas sp. TaxID=28214 RepID=UPI00286A411F|nr:NAD(P)-binding domain-containing protein [Sphingomonas sp.]
MTRHFAIIGAGAGGLCAAKYLTAKGVDVTIFEAGSKVGGLWVYDNDSGMSPAYKSLHINSEAKVSSFIDFPFPDDAPLYPDHAEMSRYFERYADYFGLTPHVRFGCRIKTVEPDGEKFQILLDSDETAVFDGVVVATGHQSVPRHPLQVDGFTGDYVHAHAYRTPAPYADKRVLVIGPGNSGVDIAADVCTVTQKTVLSARSPVLIMPRMMFGVPNSRIFLKLERPFMPWRMRIWLRTMLTRMFHGRMEQWGFRTPKTRTHPISHPTLISQIAWGRVSVKPGIANVTGRQVSFTDGTTEAFDSIIAATGYNTEIPFLSEALSPVEAGTTHVNLYNRVAHPANARLYFIGFFDVTGGSNIRMMDDQAKYIAALVTGAVKRPAEAGMRRAIAIERAWTATQFPDSPRYGLELDPRRYRKLLATDYRGRGP